MIGSLGRSLSDSRRERFDPWTLSRLMDSVDQNAENAMDVADVLARSPFARALDSAPVLVLAREPVRATFANAAALALFRANGLTQLNEMIIAGSSPGARRLRRLASALTAGAAPKLEILRFFVGRLPLSLALLCATVANASGDLFLVVAPPAAAERNAAAAEPSAQDLELPIVSSSALQKSREIIAGQRFLWGVNGQLCFDSPAEAFAHAVGAGAPHPGEALHAMKARIGL